MNVTEVFDDVRTILADVLAIELEEVTLKKTLIHDLGAESIDFLDIIFQMEKQFKIKLERGYIESMARGSLTQEEFESNGVITERGLSGLKNILSEVPEEKIKSGLKSNEIPTLFTVETMCKLVIKQKELAVA